MEKRKSAVLLNTRRSLLTGSAAVEALLIIGVLVVFMTGIPMLGSMVDLKQKTIEASRYAAWEKTIHTTVDSAVNQIETRFFMHESSPIRSIAPDKDLLGSNTLWGELTETGNAVNSTRTGTEIMVGNPHGLQLFQRARITADVDNLRTYIGEGVSAWGSGYPDSSNEQTLNEAGNTIRLPHKGHLYPALGKTVTELGSFVSKDGWGNNSPFSNGLMRSEIEIKLKNNEIMNIAGSNCSQGGAGCFQESTAILVDGWSAVDPNIIRDRVHGFVPSARLEKVGDFISKVSPIPMMKDLGKLKGAFGCVKVGVRPAKEMKDLPHYEEVQGDNC